MHDDIGRALEQNSVVTVDEKASKNDAVTELITNNENNASAFGPQLPPSPVSRISISSRRSGTRKKSNMTQG